MHPELQLSTQHPSRFAGGSMAGMLLPHVDTFPDMVTFLMLLQQSETHTKSALLAAEIAAKVQSQEAVEKSSEGGQVTTLAAEVGA